MIYGLEPLLDDPRAPGVPIDGLLPQLVPGLKRSHTRHTKHVLQHRQADYVVTDSRHGLLGVQAVQMTTRFWTPFGTPPVNTLGMTISLPVSASLHPNALIGKDTCIRERTHSIVREHIL
jgi:hypothetical protein